MPLKTSCWTMLSLCQVASAVPDICYSTHMDLYGFDIDQCCCKDYWKQELSNNWCLSSLSYLSGHSSKVQALVFDPFFVNALDACLCAFAWHLRSHNLQMSISKTNSQWSLRPEVSPDNTTFYQWCEEDRINTCSKQGASIGELGHITKGEGVPGGLKHKNVCHIYVV